MNDPSDGVPPALLKHVHLVSTHHFPTSAQIPLPTIVDRLLSAPTIAHDHKPMVWMYIDAPQNGVMLLVWQPMSKLGIEFASDGYVWADAEQAFSSEARGHTVEMYLHRSGYQYGDPIASHQRRRYRLVPSRTSNPYPNQPQPDPNLWIVHYSQAEAAHHIPVSQISMSPYVQSTLTQRKYLQQHGQLVRKEFMLRDRNSWPTINLPGNAAGAQTTAYPNNVISHMSRQQQGYVQPTAAVGHQAGLGPPPAKRARPTISNTAEAEAAAKQAALDREPTLYEEEDVSRGDLLDFLTPREISTVRYKQHHEWLGEVFRSPYDIQQIVPVELGLGRKGELEALTKDFFNAHTEPSARTAKGAAPARVGRMEDGKADEFTELANARIADINAEIEKMKRQHARRIAKLARGAELREAEKALRTASIDSEDRAPDDVFDQTMAQKQQSDLAKIQAKTEATVGKKVQKVNDVECIEKGRFVEKINESDNTSQGYDFADQGGDLSEQIPSFVTPQDALSPMEGTPDPAPHASGASHAGPPESEGGRMMESADEPLGEMQTSGQRKDGETEDWVMVNQEGDDGQDAPNEDLPDLDAFTNDAAMVSNMGTPGENMETVAEDLSHFSTGAEGDLGTDFNADNFGDGVDFGNLDTAGEALSGYGVEEGMGMDEGDFGLNDTAFGDAFHAEVGQDNDQTDS
ncbi:MAG: hypothetical protein Q9205_000333 [Flavoplaca limonia]